MRADQFPSITQNKMTDTHTDSRILLHSYTVENKAEKWKEKQREMKYKIMTFITDTNFKT